MRKIGKVKYNGKSTADLGVIVSGEASFDAAAPDYTSYQIPGKNGDLMLSNNRYLNIDVTYPAFIPADFEEKVQAIRNWMRSARSYARIEDNYDLLHFRLGMGKDVLPFEPSAENVGSNMSLVFDCKPQRYLYSGEEENQIGVWGPVQTASGDVVTFEDDENGAFKSIAASITPTQDLHGYDYPWPPGGGVNKLNWDAWKTVPIARGTAVFENNGMTLTATSSDAYTAFNTQDFPEDARVPVTEGEQIVLAWEEETNKIGGVYIFPNGETTGLVTVNNAISKQLIYTVTSGVTYVTFRFGVWNNGDTISYKNIQIVKGTTVPSWTPYSNICPITGSTEATVWRTGKNILPPITDGWVTGYVDGRNGNVVYYQNYGTKTSGYIRILPNTAYTLSLQLSETPINDMWLSYAYYDANKAFIKRHAQYKTGTTFFDFSSTSPDTAAFVRISLRTYGITSWVQLEQGGLFTTYTPYSGTSYPVSWQSEAGTVYGGTVDVVSGVLTVEWATTDLGLYTWNYSESAGAFYCGISTMKYYSSQTPIISALCSAYPNVGKPYLELGDKQLTTNMYGFSNSQKYCIIKDSAYTDAAEFKAAMSGVQLVYALATPQTYQLSGQHIKTLLGLNNVWADSGTVTAEWGEDPFGLYNPTLFDALPLIKVKNPQNGCAVTVNGTTMTCSRGHTGTVTIDCELMDVSSGATNLNADWSKDFPKLSPGENSVAFSGADAVTIIPRWWEL